MEVFQVAADDATFEDLNTIDGLQTAAHPVSDIGTGTDARIPIFHDGKDIVWVPQFVIWIVRTLGVIMESDFDVIFFHQFLKGIDSVHGLGIDNADPEALGELKDFPGCLFVLGQAHHAVSHGCDASFLQLCFHLVPDFRGCIVTELNLWFLLGKFLARIEFDDFGSSGSGLVNGFEDAEAIGRCRPGSRLQSR